MKALPLLVVGFLGVALVMAVVVGSTLYLVRPMAPAGGGPALVAPAPGLAAQVRDTLAELGVAPPESIPA